jgi:predicted nucleic acid-binding protein
VNEFLLDTDIISAHLRGIPSVVSRLESAQGHLHASVVALAELLSWVERRNTPRLIRNGLSALLPEIQWEPVAFEVARRCGELRAESYDLGRPMPLFDLLVAATALENDLIVVTHNARHFNGIPGLSVEDWIVP